MSIEKVKEYLKQWDKDNAVLEFDVSSATVDLAAQALGVIPARIAKTLSFKSPEGCLLVIAAGDARIDNSKFKNQFGFKAKMLNPDEVKLFTGYEVGGVCPFAIQNSQVKTYADISLQRFVTVYPACGTSNSAIELTCKELFDYSGSCSWVDVCKGWE
jgi:prolyl-tRNA editing enzyme YbaK/EbsC (Cys-tRNA(Pro) deacylase)